MEGKKSAMNPVKLAKFKKAMLFTDIRLDFVTFLRDFTRSKNQEPCSSNKLDEEGMKFILTLIGAISSKGNFGTDKFYNKEKKREAEELDEETTEEQAQQNYLVFKKIFSELWSEVMKWKMTSSVHRNVVILLPEKVMTHLSKPLHMSDFLLESFKIGKKRHRSVITVKGNKMFVLYKFGIFCNFRRTCRISVSSWNISFNAEFQFVRLLLS